MKTKTSHNDYLQFSAMFKAINTNYKSLFSILGLGLISTIFFTSCEKNITVDLPESPSQVVVEGYVEIGQAPYVYLSYSNNYFAPLDSAALANFTIKGAVVTISDGFITDTLIEAIPSYGYFYISTKLIGTINRNYTLTVKTQKGEVVTAQTYLHQPVALDSLWFKPQPINDTTLGFVWARLTDPDTIGNNYRWFAKRLYQDSSFIAPFGSVFDDKFINGTTVDFGYNRGSSPNGADEGEDPAKAGFYEVGDTVVVKFCSMDNTSFTFWRDADTQAANNGNPFGAIAPITSGVTGGLGVFCAYAASYDTVICGN